MEYNDSELERVNLNSNPDDDIFKNEDSLSYDDLDKVIGGNDFVGKCIAKATMDSINKGNDSTLSNVDDELNAMLDDNGLADRVIVSNRR